MSPHNAAAILICRAPLYDAGGRGDVPRNRSDRSDRRAANGSDRAVGDGACDSSVPRPRRHSVARGWSSLTTRQRINRAARARAPVGGATESAADESRAVRATLQHVIVAAYVIVARPLPRIIPRSRELDRRPTAAFPRPCARARARSAKLVLRDNSSRSILLILFSPPRISDYAFEKIEDYSSSCSTKVAASSCINVL